MTTRQTREPSCLVPSPPHSWFARARVAAAWRRRASLACGVAAVALLAACANTRRDWQEVASPPAPFEEVWDAVRNTAQVNQYTEDTRASDRGLGVFQTRWKTAELPFGRGRRSRLRAEIERVEEAPNGWLVRFYVERQTVRDIGRSLFPEEDDWSADGQDRDTEVRLLRQLQLRFARTATSAQR